MARLSSNPAGEDDGSDVIGPFGDPEVYEALYAEYQVKALLGEVEVVEVIDNEP